jgi:hypothetical protein
MESQAAFIRKFIVWGLAWILLITLLAGLFLWLQPIRASDNLAATAPDTAGSISNSLLTSTTSITSSDPADTVFFPMLFDGR